MGGLRGSGEWISLGESCAVEQRYVGETESSGELGFREGSEVRQGFYSARVSAFRFSKARCRAFFRVRGSSRLDVESMRVASESQVREDKRVALSSLQR